MRASAWGAFVRLDSAEMTPAEARRVAAELIEAAGRAEAWQDREEEAECARRAVVGRRRGRG